MRCLFSQDEKSDVLRRFLSLSPFCDLLGSITVVVISNQFLYLNFRVVCLFRGVFLKRGERRTETPTVDHGREGTLQTAATLLELAVQVDADGLERHLGRVELLIFLPLGARYQPREFLGSLRQAAGPRLEDDRVGDTPGRYRVLRLAGLAEDPN